MDPLPGAEDFCRYVRDHGYKVYVLSNASDLFYFSQHDFQASIADGRWHHWALTFDGTYIYRGNSTYSGDILYTVSGEYIYRGRSSYSGDILYTVSGVLPVPVLVMMLQ